MEEIESKKSGEIPQVVEDFDLNYERSLKFEEKEYHGGPIKEYLDSLIKNGTLKRWAKISVTCRRMIICDRELDLEKGTKLMEKTRKRFEELKSEMFEGEHTKNYNDQLLYEAIRYDNTCGLISYRCANYSSASEYFKQAKQRAKDYNMEYFIPDMTSNIIRTDFELFRHTLPEKIKSEDVHYYEEEFEKYIKPFMVALNAHKDEWHKYTTDEIKRNIYGHGMASLYHNLGDCYYNQYKNFREINESIANEALKTAEKCHRRSLSWGEKIGDIYRQLQSKRYLLEPEFATNEIERRDFEKAVLDGKWARGKQIVYQRKIERENDSKKINDWIKELRLDKNDKDKIVVLNNYDAIKKAIKKGVKDIVKNREELTSLRIAKEKIDVVENMRKKEFYLLYRRQAIHLIQDDIIEIIDDLWNRNEWGGVINWSERYSCRDLIELANISLYEGLEPTTEQREKINQCKNEILGIDREEINKHSKSDLNVPLSLTLDYKTYDKFLDLILAYEAVLKQPSKDFEWKKWDAHTVLIESLQKMPHENTAVLKFLIFAHKKKKMGRVLLIKKEDRTIKQEFDLAFVNDAKDAIEGIERVTRKISNIGRFVREMGRNYAEELNRIVYKDRILAYDMGVLSYRNMITINEIVRSYENMLLSYKKSLYNILEDLSKKLELDEELKDVKNLFIIPDGELFQLPLHLMFKEIQKSNKMNVYYSPTLTHLLTPPDSYTSNNNKDANYLWVLCPIDELCPGGKPLLNPPECDKKNIKPLKCNVTTRAFRETYSPHKFTHLGFSTHGLFHDYSKDAYVSQILFNKSFLTPYDIIFYCNFGGVQTIFLGCCKVGSSKYTDENEAIGLVTAFLSKKAVSVIAPLWTIDNITHDAFITAVNKSGIADSSKAWNLADILGKFENPYESIPFVQYASIGIVVGRLQEEKQEEILSYLRENDPSPYNPKETV